MYLNGQHNIYDSILKNKTRLEEGNYQPSPVWTLLVHAIPFRNLQLLTQDFRHHYFQKISDRVNLSQAGELKAGKPDHIKHRNLTHVYEPLENLASFLPKQYLQ